MMAHIEVFHEGRWIPWCQMPTKLLYGEDDNQVKELFKLAYKNKIDLSCLQRSTFDGNNLVKFMSKHRPDYWFRVKDGECKQSISDWILD